MSAGFLSPHTFEDGSLPPQSAWKLDLATTVCERRSKMRFPVELPAHYSLLECKTESGAGLVVNMSSSGVLVACLHDVSVGQELRLRIGWPSLLDGRIGLQLIAVGKVVRCEPAKFALSLHRHQFRTVAGTTTLRSAAPYGRTAVLES